jgi:signal transduction histidine kinase
MGLDGMRERLDLVGGRLKLESRAGAVATLVAEVSLR